MTPNRQLYGVTTDAGWVYMTDDWIHCESRGPIVRNTLKNEISNMRKLSKRARNAYKNDFMGEPFSFIADAYDEAADALQKRLDAVTTNTELSRLTHDTGLLQNRNFP